MRVQDGVVRADVGVLDDERRVDNIDQTLLAQRVFDRAIIQHNLSIWILNAEYHRNL